MCGFIISSKNFINSKENFKSALQKQSHRGPDASKIIDIGEYIIGFNRLSIIDLDERSMQPVVYKDTVLVFNGEIYNYKELKITLMQKGHRFRTSGDAEVLAALIEEFGVKEGLNRARGMFSIVVFSKKDGSLVIARDRLGIKPLFYRIIDGKGIQASSDIKGLLDLGSYKKISINRHEIYRYLQSGSMHESKETFYEDINSVAPGEIIEIRNTAEKLAITNEKYYIPPRINYYSNSNISIEELTQEIEHTLDLHVQSDVPIGLALSGGIDSTILANYYKDKTQFKAYSLLFPDSNPENHLIDKTVVSLNLEHEYVEIEAYENIKCIKKLISYIGQPFRASQTIYQHALREASARDGNPVFLTGDGADEVFAGYAYATPYAISSHLLHGNLSEAEALAHDMSKFTSSSYENLLAKGRELQSNAQILGEPLELEQDDLLISKINNAVIENRIANSLSDFLFHRLQAAPIPYWLSVEDSISMASSVESRVPYLDHHLIDKAWTLKESDFIKKSVTKYPLRKSMRNYIPNHISNLTKKYQRPGRDNYLVYSRFKTDILRLLNEPDPNSVLNTKSCLKKYLSDCVSKNALTAGKWFRILTYLLWAEENGHSR